MKFESTIIVALVILSTNASLFDKKEKMRFGGLKHI